jgi:hypothetical protein
MWDILVYTEKCKKNGMTHLLLYFYSTVIYNHVTMNVNEFAADDANGASANGAANDDEDDGSVASVVNAADEMDLALGYIGFDNIIVRDRLRRTSVT